MKRLARRMTAVPVIGLDVGSGAVKVARLARQDGELQLIGWAVRAIKDNGVFDAITAAMKQARVVERHAVLGLASPELVVKPFEVPAIPKKELASAMQLEAEQCILNGHTANEVVTDWHIVSTSNQSMRGILAVVPKTLVAARLRTAKAVGLEPVVIDVEGLAAWNAYWSLVGRQQPPGRTVLLVNVGTRTTNVVVMRGREDLMLVRDLELGAQTLGRGQGSEWTSELADSLTYARASGGLRTLDAVVLTGGGAPDALPLMEALMNVPIAIWNPLEQLGPQGLPGESPLPEGLQLAVAIGLALRTPA